MTYKTDERLKSYLDTNQLQRERLCLAVLAMDKRFSDVEPRHPRGGPDGSRDIQAIYRDEQVVFGAVGFLNQANDSHEHKKKIKGKFADDLNAARNAKERFQSFVFFTNINLTIREKDSLVQSAHDEGIEHCEIYDRERIRIALDTPDGFSTRFQCLNIPLSDEEQASFFSKWGDDIQSVIATGIQKIEGTLNRVLFLQEAGNPLTALTLSVELDKRYSAEEIGHFRFFCLISLREAKHEVFAILFGSSDKSNRMRDDLKEKTANQKPGIKYGVSSGQWEKHLPQGRELDQWGEDDSIEWTQVGSGSSIGQDDVQFISITYSKWAFIRFEPVISLMDLDDAMFIGFANSSLAHKVGSIHVYANGYKLDEIHSTDLDIDESEFDATTTVDFDETELSDPWVRIRPRKRSVFEFRFFERTPKRMTKPRPMQESRRRVSKRSE